MYKKKKRSCRKKYNAVRYNRPCYSALMAAALHIFDCPQSHFPARSETHIVNVDVELACSSHSSLSLVLSYRCPSRTSTGNHNNIVDLNFLKNFEINSFIDVCIGGRNVPIYTELDRSRVL